MMGINKGGGGGGGGRGHTNKVLITCADEQQSSSSRKTARHPCIDRTQSHEQHGDTGLQHGDTGYIVPQIVQKQQIMPGQPDV